MPMYSPTDETAAKAADTLTESGDPIFGLAEADLPSPEEAPVVPLMAAVAPRMEPARQEPVTAPVTTPAPAPRPAQAPSASGTVLLRVSVPHAASPFDDPEAAIKIVDAILGSDLAQTVHEREAMIAYAWEGKVQRRAHTVLEIRADKRHQVAIMEILTRLHPSRNPDITAADADSLSLG